MPGDKPNFIVTTPSKTIVTFKPDGRVELGEGISPSEAAKEMFAILEPMLRHAARAVSAGEAEGWLDIASAPKDGTTILLYGHGVLRSGGVYAKGMHVGWSQLARDGGIYWATRDPAVDCEPTHWRSLPPPPSAMLSAGGEG